MNTRRREKIKLFARLLTNASREGKVGSDKYEEFLSILDDLSVRELQILLLLKQLEDSSSSEANGNTLKRANELWDSFEKSIKNQHGIGSDELNAMLGRLNRTGLYETIVGAYYDYEGDRGRLTSTFDEFVRWLQVEDADILD